MYSPKLETVVSSELLYVAKNTHQANDEKQS